MTSRLFAGAVAIASLSTVAAPARAYLDDARFSAPAIEGGAGGRFFTGAPADGYTCAVCHRGGEAPSLAIEGIPLEGWDAGATYELTIRLPADVRSAGAAIEIADELGAAHGALDVVPEDELEEGDRCRTGERASELLPIDGRIVARTEVCGAARLRVRWTAPPTPVTDLRVFATVVAGDDSGDSDGDGTGALAAPLRARGAPDLSGATLGQRCAAAPGARAGTLPLMFVIALGLTALRRRRRLARPW